MNANQFIFLKSYQGVSYALECTKINYPSKSLLERKSDDDDDDDDETLLRCLKKPPSLG